MPPRLPPRRLPSQRVRSRDIDLLDHVPPAPTADDLSGMRVPPQASIITPSAPSLSSAPPGVNSLTGQIASLFVNNYSYTSKINDQKNIMSMKDDLIDFATVTDLMDQDVLKLFDPLSSDSSISPNICSSTSPSSVSPESSSCLSSASSIPPSSSSISLPTLSTSTPAPQECNVLSGKRIEIVYRSSRSCDSLDVFERKLKLLRSRFKYNDNKTNTGLVISPIIETQFNDTLSVKLIISTSLSKPPVIFTSNVNTTIEHIISHVVCALFDDSQVNFDNFLLKVYDRSEYLACNSKLMDYAYVLECHKFDRDVKLTLVKTSECSRLFARSQSDDIKFESTISTDILIPEKFKNNFDAVNFTTISTLIETLDGEVDSVMQLIRLEGDTAPEKRHYRVRQSIQAICSVLGRQTNEALRLALDDFNNRIKLMNSPDGKATRSRSSQDIDSQYELIQVTINKLYKSVIEMIHLYTMTFPVDFCVKLPPDETQRRLDREKSPVKYSIDCHESFICWIGQVSQPSCDWSENFRKFLIQIELWHGQSKIAAATSEKQYLQAGILKFPRILFDEWITLESISLAQLPRETCVYFSIIGVEYLDPENAAINNYNNQTSMCLLAMAILKLFDAEGKLLQGPQLLPMWTRDYIKDDNRFSINTNCFESDAPLLSMSLPEFDYNISFPQTNFDQLLKGENMVNISNNSKQLTENSSNSSSTPPLSTSPSPSPPPLIKSITSAVQANIYQVLNRDPLEEMLGKDKSLLWDNRESLREIPSALPRVLLANCLSWNYNSLPSLYHMIKSWSQLSPIDAMHLLLPAYPDLYVRSMAVYWLKSLGSDGLVDFLPQLIQAIRFEPYLDSPLIWYLLESALVNVRVAHSLYWLLKENFDDPLLGFRSGVIANALLAICGQKLREMFDREETLQAKLTHVSEMIKKTKENSRLTTLQGRLEIVDEYLRDTGNGVCLPLSPSALVSGLDIASCSYFTSNTLPLKLSFKPGNDLSVALSPYTSRLNDTCIEAIFKIGDDLRQDTLTMQIIRIMDKLWLKEGLDLKIVTFNCVSTDHRKGFVEMVSNSETLRKIQQEQGIAGSFNERSISEWLRKHNTYELNYHSAVENFIHSTAGYIVATYILGVCDRHNDNIMVTTAGHLFHIDFGKFLGDAQMMGIIKRDRVPFVLTSDMAYVINGGQEGSNSFQYFVELCCQAFITIRRHSNLFLSLFSLMICSSIPGVTSESVKFVHRALLPQLSEGQAIEEFTRKINDSLKAKSVQINFFVHALAQMRFTGDHNDQRLLSFVPKTVAYDPNGSKILSINIISYHKKYEPEKQYFYIVRVDRSYQPDPSFVSRTFSEFYELYSKVVAKFPLIQFPNLSSGPAIGRSNTQEVAEKRKKSLSKFLNRLMALSNEITHCDLVYTFFQPLLRDQELEADPEKYFNRTKKN